MIAFVFKKKNASQKGEVSENLANYFEAIQESDKEYLINAEDHFVHHYGLRTYTPRELDKLKHTKMAAVDKTIEGVASYRILDNP